MAVDLPINEQHVKQIFVAAITHANADGDDDNFLVDRFLRILLSRLISATAAVANDLDHSNTESEHSSWCISAICPAKNNFIILQVLKSRKKHIDFK